MASLVEAVDLQQPENKRSIVLQVMGSPKAFHAYPLPQYEISVIKVPGPVNCSAHSGDFVTAHKLGVGGGLSDDLSVHSTTPYTAY